MNLIREKKPDQNYDLENPTSRKGGETWGIPFRFFITHYTRP